MRHNRALKVLLLVGFLLLVPLPAQAGVAPPRTNSPYGMDILGVSWQWTFPREDANPRLAGSIRLDLLDSAFRQAAEAGVRWNRLAVWWCYVQPERDQWFWTDVDAAVQIARNYGIETVPELMFAPYWAVTGAPRDVSCIDNPMRNFVPANMADWENFVRAIVRRYGPAGQDAVRYWEIWNEPDLFEFLVTNPPGGDTTRIYAELLGRAARVIREEAPGSGVLLGGLSDINGSKYLDALLSLSGPWRVADSFDVLSFHAYSLHGYRIGGLRQVLDKYGLSDRPMWDTELNYYGWSYRDAAAGLPNLYRELASLGVSRSFWYKSWTSNWGPGIFTPRDPEWAPQPFTRTPFFDTFKAQAAPFRLPSRPTPEQPGPIASANELVFAWQGVQAGDHAVVGYKLQVDDDLYMGTPYFATPVLDVWVSTVRAQFVPLVMSAKRSLGARAQDLAVPVATPATITYRPSTPIGWGRFYWRVAAVDSQGNVGPYSEPQAFTVRMPFASYVPLVQ